MGLFFKKTKPDEELEREGLRGKATVLHVRMPRGGMSAGLSMNKAEEMLRGDITPIRRKVRLRVEVPERAAYELDTKLNIPVLQSGTFVAGSTVTVMVDPDDPKHLAVDWKAGIERGSMNTMLADVPMANAIMQGMGIDPQRLSQQINQAEALAQAQMSGPRPPGYPAQLPWPPQQAWPQQQGWPQPQAWPQPPPAGAQPHVWPQSEPLPPTQPQDETPDTPPS
jgi:hypothetical protein